MIFLVSVSFAQAGFLDFFNFNGGETLTGRAYTANYAGYDKEDVTCYFEGSTNEEKCYSRKDKCSDVGSCSVGVGGETGEKLTWRSTCSDEYFITTIDGINEDLKFTCAEKITSNITCVFEDAIQEHTCSAKEGSCTGEGSCSFIAEAELGQRIMLISTCGGHGYTTIGENEEASFQCGSIRIERTICDFGDDPGERFCISNKYGVHCKGVGRCLVSITGQINDRVKWVTDNNLQGYSLLDGSNEYVTFSSQTAADVKENITCQFADAGDYECHSGIFGCSTYLSLIPEALDEYSDSCKVEVEAEYGIKLTWTSTFPNSVPKITRQDGKDEVISFYSSENCLNKIDDDGDGDVDCDDLDCVNHPDCLEETITCDFPDDETHSCNYYIKDITQQPLYIKGITQQPLMELCNGSSQCSGILKGFEVNQQFEWISSGLITDDSPTSFNGNDKEITFEESTTEITQEITCLFVDDSNLDKSCYYFVVGMPLQDLLFGCEVNDDTNSCEFSLTDLEGTSFSWSSDYGVAEPLITTISENPQPIRFTPIITERITCNFPNNGFSTIVYPCNYIVVGDIELLPHTLCRDSSQCSGVLEGFELNQQFIWSSNTGLVADPSVTNFNGNNKIIDFEESASPPEYIETITCLFDDGEESGFINREYSCLGQVSDEMVEDSQSFGCRGYDQCEVDVWGDEMVDYVWTSTVPDTGTESTYLDGSSEEATFISPKYIEANWICNDGFYVDSANSPIPLTMVEWLADYIDPSCSNHGGRASYNLIEDNLVDGGLVGHAFSSIFGEPLIEENFTCIFEGSSVVEECYSTKGRCAGIGKCSFVISGEKLNDGELETVSVRSSIIGSKSHLVVIDGVNEVGIFSAVQEELISEVVTCLFTDSEEVEHACSSSNGDLCFGVDSCTVEIYGELNSEVIWSSTVKDSQIFDTIVLGSPKFIEFVENVEEEIINPSEVEDNINNNDLVVEDENDAEQGGGGLVVEDPEICNNQQDDDEDGLIDCADSQCLTNSICEYPEQTCNDNFDNDANGYIDCLDVNCSNLGGKGSMCEFGFEETCNDNFDNDADGKIDNLDEDCNSLNPGFITQEITCIFEDEIISDCVYIMNNQEFIGCSIVRSIIGGPGGIEEIDPDELPNPNPSPEILDPECTFSITGLESQEIIFESSNILANPSSIILNTNPRTIYLESKNSQGVEPDVNVPGITKTITCSFGDQSAILGTEPYEEKSTEPLFSCSYTINEGTSESLLGEESTSELPISLCSEEEGSSCSNYLSFAEGTTLTFESDYGTTNNQVVFDDESPVTIQFNEFNSGSVEPQEPEIMLTQYSWVCGNEHSVEFAYVGDNSEVKGGFGQPQSWWITEATNYCINHGGLFELSSQLPGIGVSPLTANVVYQPKTYAGWALYQLGLIG